jgi:hypothetical protein
VTRPECADNPERTDWRLLGLCRDWDLLAVDRLWFADVDEDPQARAVAAAICRGCPARNPCAAAGRDEEHGVFGGLDPGDRGALQILATPLLDDGFPDQRVVHDRSLYNAGCRCEECTEANRLDRAQRLKDEREQPRVTPPARVVPMAEQLTFAGLS